MTWQALTWSLIHALQLHDVEDSGSDGEPDTEEDLNRIEAAAAALEQRVAEAEARQAAARAAPIRPEATGGAYTGLQCAAHLCTPVCSM